MKKLLYFEGSFCPSCKALKPVVEKEAPEKGYNVEFLDIDEEDGAFFAEKYNIRSLPTLIVIENGKETKRAVGNTAWKEVQE